MKIRTFIAANIALFLVASLSAQAADQMTKYYARSGSKMRLEAGELTLKEHGKSKDDPYVFEAKGQLAVAGVTNDVTMPVKVLPLGDKKLKISGTTTLKMTDFKVEPPNPLGLGIKTGDEVKIIFDWMVTQRATPAASPAK